MRKLVPVLGKKPRSHASQVANQRRSEQQENLFDEIARLAARGLSRRKMLKLIVRGFAAAVLWRLGITPVRATQGNCVCQGENYDPGKQCCTPTGLQNNYPITNLLACPHRGPHEGYTPGFNGCGPAGYVLVNLIPNHPLGLVDFTTCCNGHDICYGTCGGNKAYCDSTFLTAKEGGANRPFSAVILAICSLSGEC
jgi:hypothetical protein